MYYFVFFFKQKTAYEMRISDWSSDVCSSDLAIVPLAQSGFTAEFGMGSGGALTLWSPRTEAGAYTWDFTRCFDLSGWHHYPCHNGTFPSCRCWWDSSSATRAIRTG